jgi:hypothetical protein
VFDLEEPALVLLDRFHQAVSFPEMVLSLETKSGAATVDFSCNDEMVSIDSSDATRATMAALLQTAWGVAPTHEHFSGKKETSEINYMWSVSRTPFGPFSTSTRLAFPLVDAAKRNQIYTALNASIAHVGEMMGQFAHFGKRMEDVLLPDEHVHFVRRWNVLMFKIRRTATFLSLLNFNTALFYSRSLRHDVYAIRQAVLRAGQFVHSYVGCVHDTESSVLRVLIYLFSGAALFIMAYVTAPPPPPMSPLSLLRGEPPLQRPRPRLLCRRAPPPRATQLTAGAGDPPPPTLLLFSLPLTLLYE